MTATAIGSHADVLRLGIDRGPIRCHHCGKVATAKSAV